MVMEGCFILFAAIPRFFIKKIVGPDHCKIGIKQMFPHADVHGTHQHVVFMGNPVRLF